MTILINCVYYYLINILNHNFLTCAKAETVCIRVNREKFQTHAMTLSLIGQCPMSKSCKIFPYTTVYFELSCTKTHTHTQTHTRTHTDRHEYSIYLQLVNRNYNDISSNKTMTMISVIGNQFNLQARENCISLQQISLQPCLFQCRPF